MIRSFMVGNLVRADPFGLKHGGVLFHSLTYWYFSGYQRILERSPIPGRHSCHCAAAAAGLGQVNVACDAGHRAHRFGPA